MAAALDRLDTGLAKGATGTHGASLVGFAFTELLGFKLLPRLRNIDAIQLYAHSTRGLHGESGQTCHIRRV